MKARLFISYKWADAKDMAKKIADKLTEEGYKVWFDEKDMRVDMKCSMSKGVTESDIFLMFSSPNYQESRPCRQEAELADKEGKLIIPIHTTPGFKPTDWLGLLEAGKLYFKFNEQNFEEDFARLLREIKLSPKESKSCSRVDELDGPIVTQLSNTIKDLQLPVTLTADRAIVGEDDEQEKLQASCSEVKAINDMQLHVTPAVSESSRLVANEGSVLLDNTAVVKLDDTLQKKFSTQQEIPSSSKVKSSTMKGKPSNSTRDITFQNSWKTAMSKLAESVSTDDMYEMFRVLSNKEPAVAQLFIDDMREALKSRKEQFHKICNELEKESGGKRTLDRLEEYFEDKGLASYSIIIADAKKIGSAKQDS